MAKKSPRPGRRLSIFLLAIVAMYGGVALGGNYQPKLGLDLQGGTRITLEATTVSGQDVTPDKLAEARGIIDARVNGSGVSEAEVSTQGNKNIIVEIPGANAKKLVDQVKQTAQLRFRLVAAQDYGQPVPKPSVNPSPSGSPSASGSSSPSTSPKPKASPTASPRGRAAPAGIAALDKTKSPKPSPKPSASPTATETATAPPAQATKGAPINQPLKWMDNPGTEWLQKFQAFSCPANAAKAPAVADVPNQPLITCGQDGAKYLLSATMIEGTQLKGANATPPNQQSVTWTVDLTFNGTARGIFADVTKKLVRTQKQFAIVLDGKVISAPTVISPIPNGQAQITGSFSQEPRRSRWPTASSTAPCR